MNEFNQTVISTIGGMITGVVISFIGLFATRKKGIAEAESRAIDEWRELYEARDRRVIRLEEKLEKMEKEFLEVKLERNELLDNFAKLERVVSKMEKEFFEVKCDRNRLLNDIEELKRTVNGEVEK